MYEHQEFIPREGHLLPIIASYAAIATIPGNNMMLRDGLDCVPPSPLPEWLDVRVPVGIYSPMFSTRPNNSSIPQIGLFYLSLTSPKFSCVAHLGILFPL